MGFLICFDLSFHELPDKYAALKPDLLLFCSQYHGGLMQPYWAYACRCHLVTAVSGPCPSGILSPTGEAIAQTHYRKYVTADVNLDCCLAHLDYNGEKLEALKRKYGRAVRISDPGFLGAVLIHSESEDHCARDMAAAYDAAR